MHDLGLLTDGVVLLLAAILAVYICHRLNAGAVVGYLAAGVIIASLGLVSHVEAIKAVGELGVVFLLFVIGLELSFRRLMSMRTEVFGLGTAQVLATGLALGGAIYLLGLDIKAALLLGFALALSSTAVVMQLLDDRGESSGRIGRTTFSILLLQDLAIIPLLAIAPLLGNRGGGATDWSSVGLSVAKAAGALIAIILIGRYLLAPLFRAVADMKRQELFFGISLLSLLGTAWATEAAGLSLTLGAFLAGLMLAETEFRHQIEVDIKPFEGLLLGLFFVTIGMTIDLGFAVQQWWRILLLLIGLIAIKATIIALLSRLIKLPWPLAIRAGLLLGQASEFAFVLVGIADRENIVPTEARQLTLAVASLSMAVTPLLVLLGVWIAGRMQVQTQIGLAALEQENLDLRDHVVIVGYGRFGQMIGRLLDANQLPFVALDMNAQRVGELKAKGVAVHYGDSRRPELLWGVGIDRAKAIVLTHGEDPAGTLRLVKHLRIHLPELSILARARDHDHAEALRNAGASDAVPDAVASSLHLAQSVMTAFELPPTDMEKLMTEFGASK